MTQRHLISASIPAAFLALATASFAAAPIDTWEPVKSGYDYILPSAAATRSTGSASKWLGYSNGDIYLNGSQVNFANFYAKDTVRPGMPTAIAASGDFDGDWAVVSYSSYGTFNSLAQITVNHNGPATTVFVPTGITGSVVSVSANPAASDILYIVTTTGAFAGSRSTKVFAPKLATDPLKVPTGRGISAVAQSATSDITAVGTDNGQVWVVSGLKAKKPVWTRVDLVKGASVLPQVIVSKIDIDSRDLTGKTIVVSYVADGVGPRITRDGGLSWTALPRAIIENGTDHAVYNVSFAPVAGATTLYGFTTGYKNIFRAVRSDNNGNAWYGTSRWSGKNLALEYKHIGTTTVASQLTPDFRVRNLGSVPVSLADKSIDYLFTPEGSSTLSYALEYSPYGSAGVVGTFVYDNALVGYRLHLTLPSYATVQPDNVSGEIRGRIWKADWSNFNQANDSSYVASATNWTLNRRAQLQVGSVIVWGDVYR